MSHRYEAELKRGGRGNLKRRTKKTKNGGIGKIGAPIRYKNKLYYPDIGDRKAQQALAKRYMAQAKKIEKIKKDLKEIEKYVVKN